MDKIGLLIGTVLLIIGMYKIDSFLIPTLDYFGKYVFFFAINIFAFYVEYFFYKKFSSFMKTVMPVVFGFVVFYIGVKFL